MLNRRDAMLRLGQLGLGSLTLPGLLSSEKAHASPRTAVRGLAGKAKSCIYIFLWGGPPQQDLWDMKPSAPVGIRSLFQPISTNVPGIQICDQMPLLARCMDKVAVVRSLTHPSTVHGASIYHMLTGKQHASNADALPRRRSDFPCFGSVLARFAEPGVMPAGVTVPRPIGLQGITHAGTYAGFLGPSYDPLEMREAPTTQGKSTHAVALPPDVDTVRAQARFGLRQLLDAQ